MLTLDNLFLLTLKDIYYAERQLLKALPKMARAARSGELKQAFTEHRQQTEGQVERLQRVFEILGKRAQGQTCEAIQGLIQETEELLDEAKEASPVRDAGLIACGQAVEHYEMARYTTLVSWAQMMGHEEIVSLLSETLAEEQTAAGMLGDLSKNGILQDALQAA